MTEPKKESIWITIPDENAPDAKVSSKTSVKTPVKSAFDKVENKTFWAAGFIALIVFVAVLFAPKEFASLMKGELFDGSFQVVPDVSEQPANPLFGGGTGTEEIAEEGGAGTEADVAATDEVPVAVDENANVVEAESEAVSIQVEPLAETETQAEATTEDEAGAETTGGTEAVTESTTTESTPSTEAPAGGEEALSADAVLLQSLSQQLEEYKKKEQENTQMIQELMQMLADQTAGLHGAASETGVQATTNLGTLPLGTTPTGTLPTGVLGTGTMGQFGIGGAGTYRYNTHTVTISPYDVLAQNQGIQAQQGAYQANMAYGTVQAVGAQTYSPALAGVKGQPGTGPKETLLLAFALSSLGILAWGVVRAARA